MPRRYPSAAIPVVSRPRRACAAPRANRPVLVLPSLQLTTDLVRLAEISSTALGAGRADTRLPPSYCATIVAGGASDIPHLWLLDWANLDLPLPHPRPLRRDRNGPQPLALGVPGPTHLRRTH